MDDTTKKMLVTVGAGLAKKVLMLQAAGLVSHGMLSSNNTEVFVSLGMAALGAAWSLWGDFGKPILLSQLEVLKAKSLAQAAKLRAAGEPAVTIGQIAAQSPTLTTTDVSKAIATLPTAVQANVANVVVKLVIAAFALSLFLAGAPAMAQTKLKLPIDPLGLNNQAPLSIIPGNKLTGSAVTDIQSFMNAKFLPDLQYALKLAQASKNNITSDCYQAWIDIITTQQTAVQTKNPDGTTTDLPMPDPHVITEFEKLVELRNALQPESPFMVKCSPVASMIRKDIASFMGIVISGGAGLATLVPGL